MGIFFGEINALHQEWKVGYLPKTVVFPYSVSPKKDFEKTLCFCGKTITIDLNLFAVQTTPEYTNVFGRDYVLIHTVPAACTML